MPTKANLVVDVTALSYLKQCVTELQERISRVHVELAHLFLRMPEGRMYMKQLNEEWRKKLSQVSLETVEKALTLDPQEVRGIWCSITIYFLIANYVVSITQGPAARRALSGVARLKFFMLSCDLESALGVYPRLVGKEERPQTTESWARYPDVYPDTGKDESFVALIKRLKAKGVSDDWEPEISVKAKKDKIADMSSSESGSAGESGNSDGSESTESSVLEFREDLLDSSEDSSDEDTQRTKQLASTILGLDSSDEDSSEDYVIMARKAKTLVNSNIKVEQSNTKEKKENKGKVATKIASKPRKESRQVDNKLYPRGELVVPDEGLCHGPTQRCWGYPPELTRKHQQKVGRATTRHPASQRTVCALSAPSAPCISDLIVSRRSRPAHFWPYDFVMPLPLSVTGYL
ncbi:hypothetical protein BDZ91DRAFT_853065 [Kalaharituber pfeilii]|nr:hypothetical protein BDZ91DRAFT_853065 [Kalaharituber pfeilii]